ncbi:hypothetical protein PUNSTDRAFT_50445 [Punctularia strigosozonata HHB-11173 SS5]|uniref:uncharacterized protein n=1 Tax=Punctularia strigosozonata (strain HHB-11173) TaxID=741275 RepID=UPI0004416F62|nr:uncharacterized protein PUNSTDRAFT_50445 [Punctularia strigosozonata HHB-11173 SS5]EIN11463.1 hypothetical protein PUNSTDRAFT_50445 [Punctularia strigosozonata HHB-11173 SS5]
MGQKRSSHWLNKPTKRARISNDHGSSNMHSKPGPGKNSKGIIMLKTPKGPRAVTVLRPELLDGFYDFMAARHQAFERRYAHADGFPPTPLTDPASVDEYEVQQLEPSEWSDDKILQKYSFANVYRMLDAGTQYLITNVINEGPQDLEETFFRVLLYRCFNKIDTWELLVDGLGEDKLTYAYFQTPAGMAAYEGILRRARGRRQALYTAAYIIPAPPLGRAQNMENHLRMIRLMMDTGLPHELAKVKHLRDAYEIMHLYPSMGPFLAFQLALDLNMTPYLNWSENEWAPDGPGSRACLRKIFGDSSAGVESHLMIHLASPEVQRAHWERIGYTPSLHPALPPLPANAKGWTKGVNGVGKGLHAGISVVDVEHSLCEAEKYYRIRYPDVKGARTEVKPYKPKGSSKPVTRVLPHKFAWLDEAGGRQRQPTAYSVSRIDQLATPDGSDVSYFSDDGYMNADVGRENNDSLLEEGTDSEYDPDQEWDVSHIVAEMPFNPRSRKGQKELAKAQAGVQYLVRYVGYGPKDDYWIPEHELDGAPDLIKTWKMRKVRIQRKINEIMAWT